jgi:hypothetical protein
MKDCEFYKFKLIHKTDYPLLNNVDIAIVLTLEDSKRKFEDPVLLNLARETYLQINKGYKKCNKPGVTDSVEDITHAYKNVFKNTDKFNNVLIFEDDAMYNKKYSIYHFKEIDKFISQTNFNIYSLGCISINFPDLKDHRYIISQLGGAHSIIYSKAARYKLLNTPGYHIDTDLIYTLDKKYKYKHPLVCQTFPVTENKKIWEDDSEIFNIYLNFTGGDKSIEPFWTGIYYLDFLVYILIPVIVIILIFIFRK